jgi:hypothetical protein
MNQCDRTTDSFRNLSSDRLLRREEKYLMAENYLKRRSDVNTRMVEGEIVVLDRQKGLIHQLNQTATYIWERCDGQATVEDLAAQLAEAFDVASETASKDVVRVVRQFQDLQLLEPPPDQTIVPEPQPEEADHVREVHDGVGEANEPQKGA